jgi:class 3 adenylate cyclase/tetratricopeptide (TPR) repeat protein
VICSNCGTTNESGHKFCKECGTQLAVTCAVCGTANTPDAKFCGQCGSPLAGRAAPVAGAQAAGPATAGQSAAPAGATILAAPVAERRLVSVLFADLVGFTTLAEGRDPEETRELLSSYFELAREVIGRHGGTIEKFIGDAVMAVWGAPVAREDDAERAVRAGLALVDAVTTLGPGIAARAGVLTGEAAVTVGATGEGMVAGDLVNTASRLQSVAPPGSVLVGDSTERATNQAIAFEAAGEQVLKGKAAPVPAFRALRVVAELGGRNRAGSLEAPFVGRDDDFRLLKDLFHATGRERRPRLVSVMGPAGIGKSRLAWEFSKYADGLVEDTYWHVGRSPSYGEGVTFWALGEMVRRRAGLLETDDDATTRQKVSQAVRQWVPDETEGRWIEPALLTLLGLDEPPAGGRDELFAAWRTFFERIAEKGETVLVFEDLQWADTGLLDFIDHLLDWTKSLPIFVITLSRPELLDRRPAFGAGRRNFVSLTLEPLSTAAMRQLLDGLAPGLPDDLAKAIVGRADGIPLYAVETVRMLVAEGKLRAEADAYRPVGDLSTIAVPETLSALIAARLDGLETNQRTVLQDAAVLGQSFSVAGLSAVSGTPAEALTAMLNGFVRRELLTLNADPRSPEHGQYAFVQALIREVAYNQLARADRKARHLAAARWFESLGDDELAGALAGHYAAAYRNAPAGPEADALAGQARIALRGAAERASNLGSREQAVAYLRQALEITDEPAERASLLERAGREATDGTPEAAKAYFEESLALYRALDDRRGIARCATGISIVLHNLYRPGDVIALLEEVVELTADMESEPDVLRVLTELTRAYANTRHARALETADRTLGLAERLDAIPIIAEGLINRALVLNYAGRYYEPATILRGLLPLAESHGLTWAQMRALNNLAVGVFDDDPRVADDLMRQGAEVSRRTGALGSLNYFEAGVVESSVALGEWDEADRIIHDLAESAAQVPSIELGTSRALLHALRGEEEAALRVLADARAATGEVSHFDLAAAIQFTDAEIAVLAGRLDDGYRKAAAAMEVPGYSQAVKLAEWAARAALWIGDADRARHAVEFAEANHRPGRVISAAREQMRAGLQALEGDAGAAATYRTALRAWRELDVPLYLGFCLTDFAILVGPSDADARAAADEARELWTRLGSPPMLRRLEEGLARWRADESVGQPAEIVRSAKAAAPPPMGA